MRSALGMNGTPLESEEVLDPFVLEYKRARDLLYTNQWPQGVEILEQLALDGSILSMILIAEEMRSGGWIFHQDLPGSVKWYNAAIERGSVRALYGLALTQMKMKCFEDAVASLESACSRLYPPAFGALGDVHFRGLGVKPDRRTAELLWRKAASMGHLGSKLNLVNCQLRGLYGASGFFEGLAKLLPTSYEIAELRLKNPHSDRLP